MLFIRVKQFAIAVTMCVLPVLSGSAESMAGVDGRIDGPFLVMTTPVEEDGSIDWDTLVKEADFAERCEVPGIIWPSGELVPYAISREELEKGMDVLAAAMRGRRTTLAFACAGRDTAHCVETVRTAERIAAKHGIRIAYLARPADDCRSQADMERHYNAIGEVATHPVIMQTFLNGSCPQPDIDLVVRLAEKFPATFGYVKEEGPATKTNDRIAALVAHKPVIHKVFGGFGGWSWRYQLRRLGADGLVTQRLMYGDVLTFVFRETKRGDPDGKARDAFEKLLAIWNLRNVFPGNELRGPQLYIFKKRGVFKNLLSLAADGKGRKIDRVELSDNQIAEIEELYAALKPYCKDLHPDLK